MGIHYKDEFFSLPMTEESTQNSFNSPSNKRQINRNHSNFSSKMGLHISLSSSIERNRIENESKMEKVYLEQLKLAKELNWRKSNYHPFQLHLCSVRERAAGERNIKRVDEMVLSFHVY